MARDKMNSCWSEDPKKKSNKVIKKKDQAAFQGFSPVCSVMTVHVGA
jgi:hypothetical protein